MLYLVNNNVFTKYVLNKKFSGLKNKNIGYFLVNKNILQNQIK